MYANFGRRSYRFSTFAVCGRQPTAAAPVHHEAIRGRKAHVSQAVLLAMVSVPRCNRAPLAQSRPEFRSRLYASDMSCIPCVATVRGRGWHRRARFSAYSPGITRSPIHLVPDRTVGSLIEGIAKARNNIACAIPRPLYPLIVIPVERHL